MIESNCLWPYFIIFFHFSMHWMCVFWVKKCKAVNSVCDSDHVTVLVPVCWEAILLVTKFLYLDCVMNMFISGALRGTLPDHWLASSEEQCGTLGHLHTPHQGTWPDARWAEMMLHIQYQGFIQDFFWEGETLMRATGACTCCCTHWVFMKFWTYLRSRNVRFSYTAFCL